MSKKLYLSILLLAISAGAYAQKTISGTVSDADEPLPGASVIEQGTTNGASTDLEGRFTLTVSDDNAILDVSYVGYTSRQVAVAGKTRFDIVLESDAEQLAEIVVNALGFTVDEKTLGSTYSKVDPDAARRSGETGVINSIAGKASGVRISRSNGDPGAGSSIQIRGANTIGGNTQPLIVIDGIAFSNETADGIGNDASAGVSQQSRLNDLNPDDIASMDILKGASAAAVWGSRAANGVIVITTKKGRNKEKIAISYAATVSVDEISSKHPLQSAYGQGSGGVWVQNDSRSWGDKIADRPGVEDVFNTTGAYFEAADGDLYYPIDTKRSRETFIDKNFDQVFQTGLAVNHNLSLSGAGEKGDYYLSFAKLDNEGIIKNSAYDRLTATLNATYKFNRWFKVRTKANYMRTTSNRIQQSSNLNGLYLGLLRNAPDVDISDYIGVYYDDGGTPNPLRQRAYRNTYGAKENPGYNNPLWTINELKNTNEVNRYVINLEATFDPLPWLTLIARGGIDNYTDVRDSFFPKFSSGAIPSKGSYYIENRDLQNFTFDFIGRSTVNLGQRVTLAAMLGYSHNDRSRLSLYTEAREFLFNTRLQDINTLSSEANVAAINAKSFYKSDRVFGSAAFSYGAVFVNLSGAYETFSSASEGVFYPAVDVSWIFSDLAVFKGSFLSLGKLRGSFGQVGVAPQRHRFNTTFETFTYSDYSDPLDITYFGGGFRLNDDRGNPDLKPEIKTEYEVGADLAFLDNRIGVNFTYYKNQIDDVLLDVSVSPSSGFNNQYKNAGKLQNEGIEVDVDATLLRHKNYNVALYGNFNNNRSEVVDLAGTEVVHLTTESVSSVAVVGQPMGALWGTRILRDPDNGNPILDANGFLQAAPEQGIIGDPNPDWRGGLGLRANYKNLDVNVLFETSQGNDYAGRTRFVLYNFGTHADVGKEVIPTEDIKDVTGTVHPADVPVRGNIADFGGGPVLLNEPWYRGRGGGLGSSPINELVIQDASWTRLREVSIGYTINSERFRNATKLSSIHIGVTGRNLALWTDVVGVDPEINQSGVSNGFGIDYFTNPNTRSYVFSVKITY